MNRPIGNDVQSADYQEAASVVLQRCDELALLSSLPDAICRLYLTPEHRRCNDTVAAWMREAGLEVWEDSAGNICGRYSAGAGEHPTLLLGSHLDTVPNAGRYDGILGVLLPLELLRQCRARGETFPFHIDVLGFGDEEGSRFGTTLLGSRALAGTWRSQWADLLDRDGVSLGSALTAFGSDPETVASASRAGETLLGYVEIHIEQGPVLEQRRQPLGVVSGIAGARRFRVKVLGHAGHAGTIPMAMRQDALVMAAEIVQQVERIAIGFDVVATVGQLQCFPGAVNVIPGECLLTIDIRAGDDATRDLALAAMQDAAAQRVAARGLQVSWEEIHNAPAVACASWLQTLLREVLLDMSLEPVSLVSGAGHDAMSVADITDVGMLFVRCAGGISHHPAESVSAEDVAVALAALHLVLQRLRDAWPSPAAFYGRTRS